MKQGIKREQDVSPSANPSAAIIFAVVASAVAAWVATGNCGLLGHPLRHILTLLSLVVAALAGCSGVTPDRRRIPGAVAAALVSVALTISPERAVNALAAPVVLAGLSSLHDRRNRNTLLSATVALLIFALFRLLCSSVPVAWIVADRTGRCMGSAIGALSGRPCFLGATLGGVDFIVLTASMFLVSLLRAKPLGGARILLALSGVVGAHLLFLTAVVFAPNIADLLPELNQEAGETVLLSTIRHALPWNIPIIGLLAHSAALAFMLRLACRPEREPESGPSRLHSHPLIGTIALLLISVSLAFCTTLSVGRSSIDGKKIVIYEKGFLNWLKPQHDDYGRLSIGMYGLLPHYIRSLGAECVVSANLSSDDLAGADLLMLIYPDEEWEPEQKERIWDYVKTGGSLWLLGEHTVKDSDDGARFNDLLEPTSMRVRFDSATYAIGGWLHSYDALFHPSTIGIPDTRNQFGIVIGASLEARHPAKPIIIGRWGWSDVGDEAGNAMMGDGVYNSGEKLGDLVLAAEQRLGKGRVVVFGDTSGISNGINMGSHPFTSRMLRYLVGRPTGPSEWWRGALSVLLAALAVGFLLGETRPPVAGAFAALLAAAQLIGIAVSYRSAEILPSGERISEYELAYIDSSHNGIYSGESWRDNGLMGLSLNLMRNGYLTLTMPEFSADRLELADLFVSVAPARKYSRSERSAILDFVERGGIFILTVGFDERLSSLPLLEEFGFGFASPPGKNDSSVGPLPMGFFKAPFFNPGGYVNYVRFHAAWPFDVWYHDTQAMAYGSGDLPVMATRRFGMGQVVVVGDTCFAMNKNLERESGQPFEGMRENPHFWRWLVTYLRDEPLWAPPNPLATPNAEHSHTHAHPDVNAGHGEVAP